MNKLIFGFVFVLLVGLGMAATSDPSYCCEKTTSGGWCVNDVQGSCDTAYNLAPTSCETTSYCRLGTCYDSEEGICMGNTPQRSCVDSGGAWDARAPEDVPQCQLGCCVISDQAAFVSLVRCKKLSTFYGIENDYRTDITDEVSCIAEANAQDVGACVTTSSDVICEFTTRRDCGASEEIESVNGSEDSSVGISSGKTFYKDYLCSAEELNTACARQTTTECYKGDVYWMDSCGNRENVYSSDSARSWNNGRVSEADSVCPASDGSNGACGNCDYLLGSRCAEDEGFGISILGIGDSNVDHHCQKTECKDRDGNKRINGESWCVDDEGAGEGYRVGSRYYREICVDGEVKVEACADYRNEICIEDSIDVAGGFSVAGCRVNRWQDCTLQLEEDDCVNTDQRDCKWVDSVVGMILGASLSSGPDVNSRSSFSNPSSNDSFSNPSAKNDSGLTGSVIAPITGNSIFSGDDDGNTDVTATNRADGICVPKFSPGLAFWEGAGAKAICGQAVAKCYIKYEKHLIGDDWKIVSGKECLTDAWAKSVNDICTSLGDCGGDVNYDGERTDDGYKWLLDGTEKTL